MTVSEKINQLKDSNEFKNAFKDISSLLTSPDSPASSVAFLRVAVNLEIDREKERQSIIELLADARQFIDESKQLTL